VKPLRYARKSKFKWGAIGIPLRKEKRIKKTAWPKTMEVREAEAGASKRRGKSP